APAPSGQATAAAWPRRAKATAQSAAPVRSSARISQRVIGRAESGGGGAWRSRAGAGRP
ncbi:hypothetical protein HMPREF0731_1384, partial [Pseudoroseomonas cervicalis ATCC 49957]